MSLIFMFFYWVIFPSAIILGAWWLYGKSSNTSFKVGSVLIGLAVFAGYLWLTVGEVWVMDNRVRELCNKDGGIKVYKKVFLPGSMFNEWGQINFFRATQGENALGQDYKYIRDKKVYKKDKPSLYSYHIKVIIKDSNEMLGESIGYVRNGGTLPGPWADSSYSCPEDYGSIPLFKEIFIQEKGVKGGGGIK